MLRPCFFPKRFNNLVFSTVFSACCGHVASTLLSKTFQEPGFVQVCAHVSLMLRPKLFNNQVLSMVFAHVAFMLRPCCFPKLFKNMVLSVVFVHVAWMLRPCCFPKRFDTRVSTGICACCFDVASTLLSKTFQEPGVFPEFLRVLLSCCVQDAFQNV